jgi:hypothetical protein
MFRPSYNGHLQAYILGGAINTIIIRTIYYTRSRIVRIIIAFIAPPRI